MSRRVGTGRVDVPPSTWEIPAAAALTWLLAAALLLPAGRGAAAWAFAGGWVWPAGTDALLSSIGGLATGHHTAGLDSTTTGAVPSPAQIYGAIAVGELLLIAATVVAVRMWWTTVGPGSVRGMATRAEAEAVLGVGQLRKVRSLLRPDLYRGSRPSDPSERGPGESGVDERLRRLSDRYTQHRAAASSVAEAPL